MATYPQSQAYGHMPYPAQTYTQQPLPPSSYYQQPPPLPTPQHVYYADPNYFRRDYIARLAELTVNSRPIIQTLSLIAQEYSRYADIVVNCIEQHIRRVSHPLYSLSTHAPFSSCGLDSMRWFFRCSSMSRPRSIAVHVCSVTVSGMSKRCAGLSGSTGSAVTPPRLLWSSEHFLCLCTHVSFLYPLYFIPRARFPTAFISPSPLVFDFCGVAD